MHADSRERTLGGPAAPSPRPDSHLHPVPTERGKGPSLGSTDTAREKRKPEPQSQNPSVHPSVSQGTTSSPAYNTEDITVTPMEPTKPGKTGSGGILPRHDILSIHVPVYLKYVQQLFNKKED